ncbi:hypothetical protein ACJMK2_038783 [Sinanodonta woodiana]|uniref:C1q domain-containing protein n=1 Tax=Sinanodonta woodiana TaxID=1069815 RepID=A0ABD3WA08_SINWO
MYYRLANVVLIVTALAQYQHGLVDAEMILEQEEDRRDLYQMVQELQHKVSRMEELERIVAEQDKIIELLLDQVKRHANTYDWRETDSNADFVYENITGIPISENKNKFESVINSDRGVRRGIVAEHVAFTAYLDHPVTDITTGMVIKFSGTLLNDGNCYNIYTGIFTVPVDGTYLFTFSIVRINQNQLVAKLVVDGVGMVDAIADPAVGLHEHQGTNAAIIRLKKGQSVWIEAFHLESGTLFSLQNDRYCTFAGVLLY